MLKAFIISLLISFAPLWLSMVKVTRATIVVLMIVVGNQAIFKYRKEIDFQYQ